MTDDRATFQVFAVSDGSGGTAERSIRAALTQFDEEVEVSRFGEVRTVEQVRQIVRQAAKSRALIVHTLVTAELRKTMFDEGRRSFVHTLDFMGPLLERMSDLLDVPPMAQPGIYGREEYDRRIEAMDFALRHDDGKHVDELTKAEIVLIGVSRTGKTPLSIYLALRGWLVANVPVVLDIELPAVLFQLPAEKVIGLTVGAGRLAQLRQTRADQMSGALRQYASVAHVRDELKHSRSIFRRARWRVVDMSAKPVEEATAEVVALVGGGMLNSM